MFNIHLLGDRQHLWVIRRQHKSSENLACQLAADSQRVDAHAVWCKTEMTWPRLHKLAYMPPFQRGMWNTLQSEDLGSASERHSQGPGMQLGSSMQGCLRVSIKQQVRLTKMTLSQCKRRPTSPSSHYRKASIKLCLVSPLPHSLLHLSTDNEDQTASA